MSSSPVLRQPLHDACADGVERCLRGCEADSRAWHSSAMPSSIGRARLLPAVGVDREDRSGRQREPGLLEGGLPQSEWQSRRKVEHLGRATGNQEDGGG